MLLESQTMLNTNLRSHRSLWQTVSLLGTCRWWSPAWHRSSCSCSPATQAVVGSPQVPALPRSVKKQLLVINNAYFCIPTPFVINLGLNHTRLVRVKNLVNCYGQNKTWYQIIKICYESNQSDWVDMSASLHLPRVTRLKSTFCPPIRLFLIKYLHSFSNVIPLREEQWFVTSKPYLIPK